jgi:HK97 family phage portal protein
MSLLSRSLQQKANTPALYRTDAPFQYVNGMLVPYQDTQKNYLVNGYNVNDIIYSIVKLIVDKVKVAPWGLYEIKDVASYKQLQSLKARKELTAQEYVKTLSLQEKALVPVGKPGKWGELLNYPNDKDTWNELIAGGVTYKLLTGNKYMYGEVIPGGANAGMPLRIKNFPAHLTQIYATGIFPDEVITGYGISEIPKSFFKPENIIHEKYFNPNWSLSHDQLYGMSPLKAALLRLKKNNSLTQAEASTFQNEGIKGILHMKGQVGTTDGLELLNEVGRLKESMMQEWTGAHNRGRIGLSGWDVGYVPIGLTSQEMQIIESMMLDVRFFCSIYGVPSQLLNDPINKTYNTYKESERALTSRCALPELKSTADSLNRKGASWGLKPGQVLDFDMSSFPELQEDVKEVATWTNSLIAISPNEQRELCGLAALPDEEMSVPWINGAGRVPLTDFQANDIDNDLDEEENEVSTDNGDEAGDS